MELPRAPALACAFSLALAGLAGCGEQTTGTAQGDTLTVTLGDYRIDPQRARAPIGRITLVVRNRGEVAHNLVLERNGREIVKVGTMLPGEQERVRLTVRGGDYRMLCDVPNHEELGQYGTLEVRRDP